MIKITKEVILMLVSLIPILFHAQFQLINFEDKTVPASPTTAALGEYGFAPIDLSSGQVNLSVPIYTIQGESIALPINFSYRAGVKIKETSPYTGHGWSMIAGGVITRSINGAVDPTPRVPNSILTVGWTDEEAFDVYQNDLDAAPDIFNYNFMGYTGQFALEDDFATPYYIKEQRNWLFNIGFSGINFGNEITIVTEDGTKYIFAATETTTINDDFHYFGDDVIVAWHLTEIISAKNNEKIVLTYYSEHFSKPILKNNTLFLNPISRTSYVEPAIDQHITFNSRKLSEIILYKDDVPVNKVTFEANTPRLDIIGSTTSVNALNKISIFDKANLSVPIKYFEINIDNVNDERLFLRSIQEFSGDGNSSKPPYEFEYINEDLLPDRLTYKADHWGYYSSTTGTEFPYSEEINWRLANSKQPTSTAKYGSLEKVTFPTGGYNIFEYENNYYNKSEFNYTTKELELRWRGSEWYNYDYGRASNYESYNFSSTADQFLKLDMTLALEKGINRDQRILEDEIEDYSIIIRNRDTNQEVFSAYFEYDPGSDDGINLFITADSFVSYKDRNQETYDNPNDIPVNELNDILNYHSGFVGCCGYITSGGAYNYYNHYSDDDSAVKIGERLDRSLYLDLKAGNYQAYITTSIVDNDMINFSSKVSLKISHHGGSLINTAHIGGGIRIKSQVIATENTENTIYYEYLVHDNNGLPTSQSSGQITEEPNIIMYTPDATFNSYVGTYDYQRNLLVFDRVTTDLQPSALWARVGSTNSGPSGGGAGLPSYIKITRPYHSIRSEPFQLHNSWINYSEVKVTNGEKHVNTGFTLHKFHELGGSYQNFYNTFSIHDGTSSFGFIKYGGSSAAITKGWPFNGLLELNPIYNKPQSVLQYKFNGFNINPTLIKEENYEYRIFTKDRFLTSSVETVSHMAFVGTTYFERKYSLLKSKETIIYDLDGNNPLTTKVGYEYNSPIHNFPTKVTTSNSKGNKIIKKTKYIPDYLSATTLGYGSSLTLRTLKNENIFAPIEEQIWKGNDTDGYKLINGKLTIYDEVSASGVTDKLYKPIKILNLETGSQFFNSSINNDFNKLTGFSTVNWITGIANYEYTTNVNLSYYDNGNLKEVSKADGAPIVYIWGYYGQYPIAKIENFTSAQANSIQTLIDIAITKSNEDNDRTLNYIGKEGDLRKVLDSIRNNALLSKSMITTYTYDPLIGITSITDPMDNTVYYEYDAHNRLEYIRDADGNLISENKYNYKN